MGIFLDRVNFVYNKRDLVHSLSILAGTILQKSYRKVDVLFYNIHISQIIMNVKAGQVLRCTPIHDIKSL